MKISYVVLIIFVSISFSSLADRASKKRVYDEMWDSAEYVGIVTIIKGEYFPDKRLDLVVEVEVSLKNDMHGRINIRASNLVLIAPNKLGHMYLVYLKLSADGELTLVEGVASAVQVQQMAIENKKIIMSALSKGKNILRQSELHEYDGVLWVSSCKDIVDEKLCSLAMSSINSAFSSVTR